MSYSPCSLHLWGTTARQSSTRSARKTPYRPTSWTDGFLEHFPKVLATFATRTGRSKILKQTLSSPTRFDQQDRLVEMITDHVSKLKLWPHVMFALVASEANRESTFFKFVLGLITHKHVVPDNPLPVGILQVLHSIFARRMLHGPNERPLSAVVVLGVIEIDDALSLHV